VILVPTGKLPTEGKEVLQRNAMALCDRLSATRGHRKIAMHPVSFFETTRTLKKTVNWRL
jgi:hypothetical protein